MFTRSVKILTIKYKLNKKVNDVFVFAYMCLGQGFERYPWYATRFFCASGLRAKSFERFFLSLNILKYYKKYLFEIYNTSTFLPVLKNIHVFQLPKLV